MVSGGSEPVSCECGVPSAAGESASYAEPAVGPVGAPDPGATSTGVSGLLRAVLAVADEPVSRGLGCADGLAADVSVLARIVHMVQAELARRVVIAEHEDALVLDASSTLAGLGWSKVASHRLVAAARFAEQHPVVADPWREGAVGVEHVAVLERDTRDLSASQVDDLAEALVPVLPRLTVGQVRRACAHAVALARPDLADAKEQDSYDQRYLAFTRFADVVSFEGRLAGVDGAAFQAAIASCAESLRAEGDALSPGQRNADALMLLVSGTDLPKLGGLPAAVTLILTQAQAEQAANRNRAAGHGTSPGGGSWFNQGPGQGRMGHDLALGNAAARFGLCAAEITPMIVEPLGAADPADPPPPAGAPVDPPVGAPVDPPAGAACGPVPGSLLDRLGFTKLRPLAVGRSQRLATAEQRKALAVRDGGCVIPGCEVGPEHTQSHHVTEWSLGGATEVDNLASVCWPHHRQTELRRWTLTRSTDPNQPWWTVTPTPKHRWRGTIP